MAILTKEEKQAHIRKTIFNRYIGYIRKDDEPCKMGQYSFVTAFEEIAGGSCYEIHDMLKKHGVVTKGINSDHEHSCCYYYFKKKETAERFVNRLADFMVRRMAIASEYMLVGEEFDWFHKIGCYNYPEKK